MATENAAELVLAGKGEIHIAPIGTALPTTPTGVLNAAFIELGFTDDTGIKLKQTRTITDFFAWQSKDPVRRELISRDLELLFNLQQWNGDNVCFALGGGDVINPAPGIFEYQWAGASDPLDERALVADWHDGIKNYRLVAERGTVAEAFETDLARKSLSQLPVGWKALAPENTDVIAFLLTDDPAFHSAS